MARGAHPRLATSYAANVTLVVLTLFPGLINTSAIALAAPVIGADLGVAPDAAAGIPLAGDAALAFGCLLGAELTRRIASRPLFFGLLGATIVTSLASALAISFPVLLIANAVHGLAAGMLFIVVLPPLLTNFKSDKLGATASVMVPALFGAVTLGPLIGGAVAAPGAWRIIFAVEAIVAIVAFVLARSVLEHKEPAGADQPVDWVVLVASALGSLLLFSGAGVLAGTEWRDPLGSVPFVAGLLVYVALLAAEATKEHPLVPVRKLAPSLALAPAPLADAAVRAFITGRPLPPIAPVAMMHHALSLAIGDAYVIVLALALAGIVAIAALMIATRVTLRTPDLARFDEGRPALDAPALA